MNKEEAIEVMMRGFKITHQRFLPDEWVAMCMGMMVLSDRTVCTPAEFWHWRFSPVWDNGYELYGTEN